MIKLTIDGLQTIADQNQQRRSRRSRRRGLSIELILIFSTFILFVNFFQICYGKYEADGFTIVYDDFEEYKSDLNKSYDRDFMESRCRQAYEENCKKIRAHNEGFKTGKYSYQLRANCLADLSTQQYMKRYVRLVKSQRRRLFDRKYEDQVGSSLLGPLNLAAAHLPESLDWRDKGFLTPANNQKSCGSCYAFSIAHSITGQVFKRTGKIVPLSEQQIVDCSVAIGNHGCAGGSLRNTLKYLELSGGLMREQDYPYAAEQQKCLYRSELAVVNITTWAILPARDEETMKLAIATIGPIAVSINASPQTFQLYSHGIYDDDACSANTVNHAMLAIGYTKDYWILKNWWGSNWGDGGYMKIKRNKNLCGLANYAAYAII